MNRGDMNAVMVLVGMIAVLGFVIACIFWMIS